MPEIGGVEMLRRSRLPNADVRLFVYSGVSCPLQIRAALQERPHGFVKKTDSLAVLRNGLQTVVAGGVYLSAAVANHFAQTEIKKVGPSLSGREREIIRMVAENHSAKEIATRLNLSTKTVENHKTRLMDKLNLHGVAALTRFAIRERIIDLG